MHNDVNRYLYTEVSIFGEFHTHTDFFFFFLIIYTKNTIMLHETRMLKNYAFVTKCKKLKKLFRKKLKKLLVMPTHMLFTVNQISLDNSTVKEKKMSCQNKMLKSKHDCGMNCFMNHSQDDTTTNKKKRNNSHQVHDELIPIWTKKIHAQTTQYASNIVNEPVLYTYTSLPHILRLT